MKLAGIFLLAAFLLPAADGPHFDITDARGKKPAGVAIEAGEPDADGWFPLKTVVHGKGDPMLVWPFDGAAKRPDGPEPIPVIVIPRGDEKALANHRVVATLAARVMLGFPVADFPDTALSKAVSELLQSSDAFEKGVGLLYAKKYPDAAEELAHALKDRQNQLTRFPSEIHAVAILYGQALMGENKFDAAAVAFLTALKQRPSSDLAQGLRAEALTRAGKSDAIGR